MWEFNIWQDGLLVAGGGSNSRAALVREAIRYAAQYAEDGGNFKLTIREKKPRQRREAKRREE